MSYLVLAIIVVLLGVVLNGLFAGYETGFVSTDRMRMRYLAEEEGNKRAEYIARQLANPDRMLTTVLVGTNLGLIVGTMALTSQVSSEWIAMLIATPLFLIFAEVIPKSVFRRHPNRLCLLMLPFIRVSDALMSPLIYPTTVCLKVLRRLTGTDGEHLNPIMTSQEDLRHLVDESAARGSIDAEEQEMIHSVMDLQKTQSKEIMVPRIDIDALPETATRDELIAVFEKSGRTRIPIYRETVDSVIGTVNAYDLLLDDSPDVENISRFVKEVMHVPDTMPVDDLLQEFKQKKQIMAVVTDEYGGTDGLITLEDVLEEIFGEIRDEHDVEQDLIHQVGPNAYIIDARMSLEDASEAMGVALTDETVETVGGWVMHGAGKIPKSGEKLEFPGMRITVLSGAKNQVSKIRLEILPDAHQSDEGETT